MEIKKIVWELWKTLNENPVYPDSLLHGAMTENFNFKNYSDRSLSNENHKKRSFEADEVTEDSSQKRMQLDKDFIDKTKQEIKQKDNYIKRLEDQKEDFVKNINNLEQHIKEQKNSFEQTQEQYNKIIESLEQKLNEKGDGFRELEEKNAKLREEASKLQSALGVATNTRLGDDDQNHSVKFKQDIMDLQKTLEDYVTNLKPNVGIIDEQVQTLAQSYGCSDDSENLKKPFVKALLQRKALDYILELIHELSEYKDEEVSLELGIELKAKDLLKSIEKFSTTRVGSDKIVNIAAIKVRQQVYGILGNRGFADIIHSDGNRMHDFISSVSDKLNNMMNQYRTIKDVNRKKEVEAMAPKLIHDMYRLFWFRFNVQEPIIQYYFCEINSKIDPIIMKGRWDDDEIDQSCVGICYFPMIGRDLESSNRKLFTPAKVFPRSISS